MSSVWRRLLPREERVTLSDELRRAVAGRDWPTVQAHLEAMRGEREVVLDELAKSAVVREWTRGVVADDATPSLTLLLAASCHLWVARERSGSVCARCAPTPEQRQDPVALGMADSLLRAVAEREPEWVQPWSDLFIVALGLGTDRGHMRHLFDEVVRREPEHLPVHVQYLQQLGTPHGGSDDDMHAFAYGAMTHAPEGSSLGVLIPHAHLESLRTAGYQGKGYLRNPLVARQLHHAADRSVRHPDYRRGPEWVWVHNVFAMSFYLTGQLPAAREMFRALDGRYTRSPWQGMPGKPLRAHRRARHRSGVWW
ncbi:hypothetical protein E1265_14665 [Streptomyces sp. 8K308]|nr:hypothetical protein E1265_14665 [Streptomyces sp. 8K308]